MRALTAVQPVDPRAIFGSALKLWLTADLGIDRSGADVSTWTDQSGNGHVATWAGAKPQYNTVAGRPSIDTDASRYFTIPDAASLQHVAGQAYHVWAVIRSSDSGTSKGVCGKSVGQASGIEWALLPNNGNHAEPAFYVTGAAGLKSTTISTADASNGEDTVVSGRLTTGSLVQVGVQGVWNAGVALGGAITVGTAQITIGRYAFNSGGLVGSIREIVIVRRATDATAAEERALLAWFRNRWPIP